MKYKDRYVLATGYPVMSKYAIGVANDLGWDEPIAIKWPEELWGVDEHRYRLVLERVKGGKK